MDRSERLEQLLRWLRRQPYALSAAEIFRNCRGIYVGRSNPDIVRRDLKALEQRGLVVHAYVSSGQRWSA